MKLSLGLKLVLWNCLFFLLVIVGFGANHIWISGNSATRILDDILIARAREVGHRPGPRPMGEPRSMPLAPPPDRVDDLRRPLIFGHNGESRGPSNDSPRSASLLRRSMNGEIATGNVVIDGQTYRVASVPIVNAGGEREIVQVMQDAEALRIAQRGQWIALLSALPFAICASAAIGFVLSRLVLRPISRLTEIAKHVSEDPHAKERIQVNGSDEMATLSQSFNAMTDRLQDALDRQTRFTSDAAHELRTPLTGILLAAENGLHPEATDEERVRALRVVDNSARTMKRLTDVLLSLSRFDKDNPTLPLSFVSLRECAIAALEQLNLANDRRILWNGDEGSVLANKDATIQILRNLIENAANYTPQDGAITFEIVCGSIAISDTGPGIAPEHLSHVFERFYRADDARTRTAGGHGLGLSIVKALCDAQGASITVESKVGLGTKFVVSFPQNS